MMDNNIFYNNKPYQFSFDKIYPNKKTMDTKAAEDEVLAGRYVYIDYYLGDGQIDNNYNINAKVDAAEYPDFGQKYHGTLWQKRVVENQLKYVFIAKLTPDNNNFFPASFTPLSSEKKIIIIDDETENANKIVIQDNGDFSITINGQWVGPGPTLHYTFIKDVPIPPGKYLFTQLQEGAGPNDLKIQIYGDNNESWFSADNKDYILVEQFNHLTAELNYEITGDVVFTNFIIRPDFWYTPVQVPEIELATIAPSNEINITSAMRFDYANGSGSSKYQFLWPATYLFNPINQDDEGQEITDLINAAGFEKQFVHSDITPSQHKYKDLAQKSDITDGLIKKQSGRLYSYKYENGEVKPVNPAAPQEDTLQLSLRLTSMGTAMGKLYDSLYGVDRKFLDKIKTVAPVTPVQKEEYALNGYLYPNAFGGYSKLIKSESTTIDEQGKSVSSTVYNEINIPTDSAIYQIFAEYLTTLNTASLVISKEYLNKNILDIFNSNYTPQGYADKITVIEGGSTLVAQYSYKEIEPGNDENSSKTILQHIFTIDPYTVYSTQNLFSVLTIPSETFKINDENSVNLFLIQRKDLASDQIKTIYQSDYLLTSSGAPALDEAFKENIPTTLLIQFLDEVIKEGSEIKKCNIYIDPTYSTYSA